MALLAGLGSRSGSRFGANVLLYHALQRERITNTTKQSRSKSQRLFYDHVPDRHSLRVYIMTSCACGSYQTFLQHNAVQAKHVHVTQHLHQNVSISHILTFTSVSSPSISRPASPANRSSPMARHNASRSNYLSNKHSHRYRYQQHINRQDYSV